MKGIKFDSLYPMLLKAAWRHLGWRAFALHVAPAQVSRASDTWLCATRRFQGADFPDVFITVRSVLTDDLIAAAHPEHVIGREYGLGGGWRISRAA